MIKKVSRCEVEGDDYLRVLSVVYSIMDRRQPITEINAPLSASQNCGEVELNTEND